jgi:hypothetical protein
VTACAGCGRENPDAAKFCGSCGAKLIGPPPAAVAPAPAGGPEAPGVAPAAVAPGPEDGPEASAVALAETEAQRRLRALVARVPEPGATPVSPPVAAAGPRPPAVPVERAGPSPTEPPPHRQPEAVKPGAAAPRVAPAVTPSQPAGIRPGDVVCPNCGSGNEPQRRFCRRCGVSLVQAAPPPVAARVPWWRRLFAPRPERVATAGERPARGRSGGVGRALRKIGAVLLGVAVVAVVGPWRGAVGDRVSSTVRSVRRAVSSSYVPARPTAVVASSALDGHGAEAAIDGVSTSAWSEDTPGDGDGQQLTFTFGAPVDIDRVGITPGASTVPADFLAQPRPREVRLTFPDGSFADLTLKDEPGFQTQSVKARRVDTVVLEVRSVYPSATDGHDGSVAEVEFFAKR